MEAFVSLLMYSLITMVLVMSATWLLAQVLSNPAVVDVAWTFGTGGLAVWYCTQVGDLPARRTLLGVVFGAWSLRLGSHLLWQRVLQGHSDRRYDELLDDQTYPGAVLFGFYQLQALLAVMFSAAALGILYRPETSLTIVELAGALICLLGVGGEGLADYQLHRFKQENPDTSRTCRRGLWNYSRHPNYFFELSFWFGIALMASFWTYGWFVWLAPGLMIYFILGATGIPATERHAVQSRSDYRNYQKTTNRLIPWFPRETNP